VTDACISWDTTVLALEKLREGVRARRAAVGAPNKLVNGVKAAMRNSLHVKSNGANGNGHAHPDQVEKGFNDDAMNLFSRPAPAA
jgi:3-deoxy-7-phosphoheptulonate synthase